MNPEHLDMPSRTDIYSSGAFQLDVYERKLLHDDAQVPLRLKAFETLRELAENAGHLETKETLLKQAWSDAVVDEEQHQCYCLHSSQGTRGGCKWPVLHRNCATCGIPSRRKG